MRSYSERLAATSSSDFLDQAQIPAVEPQQALHGSGEQPPVHIKGDPKGLFFTVVSVRHEQPPLRGFPDTQTFLPAQSRQSAPIGREGHAIDWLLKPAQSVDQTPRLSFEYLDPVIMLLCKARRGNQTVVRRQGNCIDPTINPPADRWAYYTDETCTVTGFQAPDTDGFVISACYQQAAAPVARGTSNGAGMHAGFDAQNGIVNQRCGVCRRGGYGKRNNCNY